MRGQGPDNGDIFGTQNWENLMDWSWRMREGSYHKWLLEFTWELGRARYWDGFPIPTFLLPPVAINQRFALKSPSPSFRKKPWFVTFADFYAVNTLPIASLQESCIVNNQTLEPIGARPSTPNHQQVSALSSCGSASLGGGFKVCQSSFPFLSPLHLCFCVFSHSHLRWQPLRKTHCLIMS